MFLLKKLGHIIWVVVSNTISLIVIVGSFYFMYWCFLKGR